MSTRSTPSVEDPRQHQLPPQLARRVDAVSGAELARPPRAGRAVGLAATLRRKFHDDVLAEMWATALSGHCPIVDASPRAVHGYVVSKGAQLDAAGIAMWFKMFLERAHGAPAQHVVLDAEVSSRIAMVDAVLDPSMLTPAALGAAGVDATAVLAMLRAARRPAPVIDVEPDTVEAE